MTRSRGQASFEYITMTAIALAVLVPSTAIFFNYTQSTTDEVLNDRLNLIGETLLAEAEEMYLLGSDSWTTADVTLPNSFQGAEIYNNRDLVFNFSTSSGPSQTVFFATRFNISRVDTDCSNSCNLNFTRGSNKIRIRSDGETVNFERIN